MDNITKIAVPIQGEEDAKLEQVAVPRKRFWWQRVDTKYLFKKLQTSKNRVEIAAVLVELAERAERNPLLQEMLSKIELRPPFDIFEYIKPKNRKGYFARKPYWREHPTLPQLMAKLEFSEMNYSLFGERGLVERNDGTYIARVPYLVGEMMKGRTFVGEDELIERKRQKMIDRIVQVVEG